jgi:hypothetical protein
MKKILKETIDGKTGFCRILTDFVGFLWESFFQLIAEKATANFDVTNWLANRCARCINSKNSTSRQNNNHLKPFSDLAEK